MPSCQHDCLSTMIASRPKRFTHVSVHQTRLLEALHWACIGVLFYKLTKLGHKSSVKRLWISALVTRRPSRCYQSVNDARRSHSCIYVVQHNWSVPIGRAFSLCNLVYARRLSLCIQTMFGEGLHCHSASTTKRRHHLWQNPSVRSLPLILSPFSPGGQNPIRGRFLGQKTRR